MMADLMRRKNIFFHSVNGMKVSSPDFCTKIHEFWDVSQTSQYNLLTTTLQTNALNSAFGK